MAFHEKPSNLVVVFDIHISNQVVAKVVHYDDIFNLTIVSQLQEDLDVECLQVLLCAIVPSPRQRMRKQKALWHNAPIRVNEDDTIGSDARESSNLTQARNSDTSSLAPILQS